MSEKKIESISFSKSLEGAHDFTGTLIYTQEGTYEEIKSGVPELGESTKYFPSDCVLQDVTAQPAGGKLWRVTCKFYPAKTVTLSADSTPRLQDAKLNTKVWQVSILLHPRYNGKIPEGWRGVMEKLRNSNCNELIPTNKGNADYEPDVAGKKDSIKNICKKAHDAGKLPKLVLELYDKIVNKGVKNHQTRTYTITETEQEKSFRPSNKLNKICEPKTPGIKNLPWKEGNWILAQEDVVYSPATKTYKVTRVYNSSDEGHGWDPQLYGR